MILAGIDIGTNTLRLLVAETGADFIKELYADRKITRLGQDLDRTGLISEEAWDRSLSALIDFNKKIRSYSALQTALAGTSALRNASNSARFIAAVKERTGLELAVISGEEEARLSLLGVAMALKEPGHPGNKDPLESAFVVDIGGGSTEIIMTRKGAPPVVLSLPLGAVYLTERFIRSDPPSTAERGFLRQAIRSELEQHPALSRPGTGCILVGSAGTVTALSAIDQKLTAYDPRKINRHELSRAAVERIVRELGERTLSERRGMAGLDHGREDIIFAGALILLQLMEQCGFGRLLVSDWGLREGIVLDLYSRAVQGNRRSY